MYSTIYDGTRNVKGRELREGFSIIYKLTKTNSKNVLEFVSSLVTKKRYK